MKVMPTLEGGLRIDAEEASDWELLCLIVEDAAGCDVDLASRLGGLIGEDAGGADWEDYVVPDLREEFQDQVAQIGAAVEAATFHAQGGLGHIWITREDAAAWYSALNQARLALEERFRFGPDETGMVRGMEPECQAAYIRSRFYCEIQSLMLEYVMK